MIFLWLRYLNHTDKLFDSHCQLITVKVKLFDSYDQQLGLCYQFLSVKRYSTVIVRLSDRMVMVEVISFEL